MASMASFSVIRKQANSYTLLLTNSAQALINHPSSFRRHVDYYICHQIVEPYNPS
jgi:hypothetical protein